MVYFIFDFAVMPDGQVVLDIPPHRGGKLPNPWDFIHAEDMYNLQYAHQSVEAAYYLVNKALSGLRQLGVEHCNVTHKSDPWLLMRAVGYPMKVNPFANMTFFQLRHGLQI